MLSSNNITIFSSKEEGYYVTSLGAPGLTTWPGHCCRHLRLLCTPSSPSVRKKTSNLVYASVNRLTLVLPGVQVISLVFCVVHKDILLKEVYNCIHCSLQKYWILGGHGSATCINKNKERPALCSYSHIGGFCPKLNAELFQNNCIVHKVEDLSQKRSIPGHT